MDENKDKKNAYSYIHYLIGAIFVIAIIVFLIFIDIIPAPSEQNKTCECIPCNVSISLSNYSSKDGFNLTCCVNATWDKNIDACNYTYLTKNIKLDINRTV